MKDVWKIALPMIVYLLGFVVGYTRLQAQAEGNYKQIEQIQQQMIMVQEDINLVERGLDKQEVKNDNVSDDVKGINKKIDKIVDLLLEIKSDGG